MTLSITLDRERQELYFSKFKKAIPFQKEEDPIDGHPFVFLYGKDTKSNEALNIRINTTVLQKIGISANAWTETIRQPERFTALIKRTFETDELLQRAIPIAAAHLSLENLSSFQGNRSLTNRSINLSIVRNVDRCPKSKGIPGIYIDLGAALHIFINLKATPPLGTGSYGKVRKALWLTAPNGCPQVIAKKVTLNKGCNTYENDSLKNEVSALATLKNKRGIISLICGRSFKKKCVIFLPLYDMDLKNLFTKPYIGMNEILNITSQLLEGLAEISEHGIHGDISDKNILVKMHENNQFKVSISDFGTFCIKGKIAAKCCTPSFASPEYFTDQPLTDKHDSWGLALCLLKFVADFHLLNSNYEVSRWTSQLEPGWALKYTFESTTPPFLPILLSDMLHPNPTLRLSSKNAWIRFSQEIPNNRAQPIFPEINLSEASTQLSSHKSSHQKIPHEGPNKSSSRKNSSCILS